ncbi:hypothetical protein FQA39_LY12436 [Lamprigera yunnana]|nr:hypothetical protein FQA39_LY12436 [Lamprigera yunnana]
MEQVRPTLKKSTYNKSKLKEVRSEPTEHKREPAALLQIKRTRQPSRDRRGTTTPFSPKKGTSATNPASKEVGALWNAGYLKLCREPDDEGAPVPGGRDQTVICREHNPFEFGKRRSEEVCPDAIRGATGSRRQGSASTGSDRGGEDNTTPDEIAPPIMTHQNTTNTEYDNCRV